MTGGAAAEGTGSLGRGLGIGAALGRAGAFFLTGAQTFRFLPVFLLRTVLQTTFLGFLRLESFTAASRGDRPGGAAH
jgi:hypothetical protein